jgi:hypothetical protein
MAQKMKNEFEEIEIRGAPRKASGDVGKGPTKHEKGPRRVLHEHRERAPKGAPGRPGEGPRGNPEGAQESEQEKGKEDGIELWGP